MAVGDCGRLFFVAGGTCRFGREATAATAITEGWHGVTRALGGAHAVILGVG